MVLQLTVLLRLQHSTSTVAIISANGETLKILGGTGITTVSGNNLIM